MFDFVYISHLLHVLQDISTGNCPFFKWSIIIDSDVSKQQCESIQLNLLFVGIWI